MVIDTSVWISGLLPADPNHHIAVNWIDQYVQSGGILIGPTLLVIETAAGISRVSGQPILARRAASQLYGSPFFRIVPLDQKLVDETADTAADFRLRGADAVFVALARIEAIPLVTFDHEQLTRPASIIATVRP
jgi:predicted nucleic acid-binding protein